MNLLQDKNRITGEVCEQKGQDCMKINNGRIDNNAIGFDYKIPDKNYGVNVKLTVESEGKELAGTFSASDGSFSAEVRFFKKL